VPPGRLAPEDVDGGELTIGVDHTATIGQKNAGAQREHLTKLRRCVLIAEARSRPHVDVLVVDVDSDTSHVASETKYAPPFRENPKGEEDCDKVYTQTTELRSALEIDSAAPTPSVVRQGCGELDAGGRHKLRPANGSSGGTAPPGTELEQQRDGQAGLGDEHRAVPPNRADGGAAAAAPMAARRPRRRCRVPGGHEAAVASGAGWSMTSSAAGPHGAGLER
jgi:hypothetical protein